MRAAVLTEVGTPRFGEMVAPVPRDGEYAVRMIASAVNPIDIAMAAGRFYTGLPLLPSVVGQEGVGETADGDRVYFMNTVAPHGAMGEIAVVDRSELIQLRDDDVELDVLSIGNAGVAAWLALTLRANLRPGERVLILGASGMVGRFAVQFARALGASAVIAVCRRPEANQDLLDIGASEIIGTDSEPTADILLDGVDVTIDLLWGSTAVWAMRCANPGMRFVQVGNAASAEVTLPAAIMRQNAVSLIGHANFSTNTGDRADALRSVIELHRASPLIIPRRIFQLESVEEAWRIQQTAASSSRTLISIG